MISCLIVHDRAFILPKQLSIATQKYILSDCSAYEKLGEFYEQLNFVKMEKHVESCRKIFTNDNVFEIVEQCLSLMVEKRVKQISDTYKSISITSIEKMLGPVGLSFIHNELGKKLEDMILNRKIYASISEGIVFFQDPIEQLDSENTFNFINLEMKIVQEITGMFYILTRRY